MIKNLIKKIIFAALLLVIVLGTAPATQAFTMIEMVINGPPVTIYDDLRIAGNSEALDFAPSGNLDIYGAIGNSTGNLILQDDVDLEGALRINGNILTPDVDPVSIADDLSVGGNVTINGASLFVAGGETINSNLLVYGDASANRVSAVGNITSTLGTIGRFYNVSCGTATTPDGVLTATGEGYCYEQTPGTYKQIYAYCALADLAIACSGYQDGQTNRFKGALPDSTYGGGRPGCKAAATNSVNDGVYNKAVTTDAAYAYAFCFSPNG